MGDEVSQSHNGIWDRRQNAKGAVLLSTGGMPHAAENFFEKIRYKGKQ
jgi:hypothetical protein